jgi:hypothetical protein
MSDPVTGGFQFLYQTLTGDATFMTYVTGVWADVAPALTNPDYCILALQSPTDVLTANAVRVMSSNLYQVKLVGPTADYANLSAAYARAQTLLDLVRSQSGILACYRENGFYLPELVDGVPWVALGGLYRVEL